MQERTRRSLLLIAAILLVGLLAVWWYSGFSLEFMRFFAAERLPIGTREPTTSPCPPGTELVGYTNSIPPQPICSSPSPAGAMVRCSPATQTVRVGVAANLSASGGDSTYTWFAPEGARVGGVLVGPGGVISNTLTVVYDTAGTKKVTVQSPRGDGSANVDSVACTVVVSP